VIANVQRGGPGLGNIAPSQGDYFQATRGGGHGDYRTIVLSPASVQEMHNLTIEAFYLADIYRMPVMILADGRVGQMMEPIRLFEETPPPVPKKDWALTGAKGRKPNIVRSLLLEDGALTKLNEELQQTYKEIHKKEKRWETESTEDSTILIAAWGTCARIARAAVEKAREHGIKAGLFRPISLWPFPEEAFLEASRNAKTVLVVEMNCGQMLDDIKISFANSDKKVAIEFSGFPGGLVPAESDILKSILKIAGR
jgi:2-oxoglutarate ferredoxin oxidoreductase subunit alpha